MSNKYTSQFPDVDAMFALKGERVTYAKTRDVIKTTLDGQAFYIKRYTHSGKGLRKYLGRSRLRAEWENLQFFASLGIPVPELVAFGEHKKGFAYDKGAMVLREIPDVVPLNEAAQFEVFKNPHWREAVLKKVAHYLRLLHNRGFAHGDFYLRNILVSPQGKLFFIDCPQGKKRIQPLRQHWQRKDLKCFKKEAKDLFSEAEIAYFMAQYKGQHLP